MSPRNNTQSLDEEDAEKSLRSLAEAFDLCYDDVLKLYEQNGHDIKKLVKRVAEVANY